MKKIIEHIIDGGKAQGLAEEIKKRLAEKVNKKIAQRKLVAFEGYLDDRGETPGQKDMVNFVKANTEVIDHPPGTSVTPDDATSVTSAVDANIDIAVIDVEDEDDAPGNMDPAFLKKEDTSPQLANLQKQQLDLQARADTLKGQVAAQKQRDAQQKKAATQANKNKKVNEDAFSTVIAGAEKHLDKIPVTYLDGSKKEVSGTDARILKMVYNGLSGDLKGKFQALINKSATAYDMAMKYALRDTQIPVLEDKFDLDQYCVTGLSDSDSKAVEKIAKSLGGYLDGSGGAIGSGKKDYFYGIPDAKVADFKSKVKAKYPKAKVS